MSNNTTVFIDSDDVLGNWGERMFSKFPSVTNKGDLNKIDNRDARFREVYEHDIHFFKDLHVIVKGRDLIKELNKRNIKFKVLTALGSIHPDKKIMMDDKLYFLKREFNIAPEDVVFVPESADKASHAAPGKVLVDDYHRNVGQWSEKGGTGILFTTDSCPKAIVTQIEEVLACQLS